MPHSSLKKALAAIVSSYLIGSSNFTMGQESSISDDDATVVYPASYFAQYQLLSVSDMLDRIPGTKEVRGVHKVLVDAVLAWAATKS